LDADLLGDNRGEQRCWTILNAEKQMMLSIQVNDAVDTDEMFKVLRATRSSLEESLLKTTRWM